VITAHPAQPSQLLTATPTASAELLMLPLGILAL
jgi:hypothetical protein